MKDNNNSMLFSTAAFTEMQEIVDDLANCKLSTYGVKALVRRLKECVAEHEKEIFKMVKVVNDQTVKYKELYDKYSMPQKLNKEFIDIAKTLNFPIEAKSKDYAIGSVANPNIEMPFEDPVPKDDVDFMQKMLKEDTVSDVDVPKEEKLSEDEITAYRDVDNALHGKFKIEKMPNESVGDAKATSKTAKKRRCPKKAK